MTDDEFRQLRGYYSDANIVELTFTVCYFNYFTRMVEGLGLPVESWVIDPSQKPMPAPAWTRDRSPARVELLGRDDRCVEHCACCGAPRTASGGLGLGMVNSQRAMMQVPALAEPGVSSGAANGDRWLDADPAAGVIRGVHG